MVTGSLVRRSHGHRLGALGVFVALALFSPVPAAAQTLDGPRVVRFGQSYPLTDTERVLLRGKAPLGRELSDHA